MKWRNTNSEQGVWRKIYEKKKILNKIKKWIEKEGKTEREGIKVNRKCNRDKRLQGTKKLIRRKNLRKKIVRRKRENREGWRKRVKDEECEKPGELEGWIEGWKSVLALKCWKVFRCVRANRSVKAPLSPPSPPLSYRKRSRLRVYKAWRNGMKGFGARLRHAGGLEYRGFSSERISSAHSRGRA